MKVLNHYPDGQVDFTVICSVTTVIGENIAYRIRSSVYLDIFIVLIHF
jgi:hypothetical protein